MGKVDWDKAIGRRVRWQSLHVFRAVAQLGSLSQAARHFGCTQPAISGTIAELENALGVKLLDRSTRGVQPNIYGRTLLRRCEAAFDELKQGLNDIENMAGSAQGDLRIGCTEAVASAILQPIIERFSQKYPDVVLRLHYADSLMPQLTQLRDRNIDVSLARWRKLPVAVGDFDAEMLFNDEVVVAASKRSRWAQRSRIEVGELAHESWILTPPDSWNYLIIEQAFRNHGLPMPKPFLMTYSVPLRVNLVASGAHIAAIPASVLRFNPGHFGVSVLPIDLPPQNWPVAIVTLKNRVLSAAAQLFCEHVRTVTKALAAQPVLESKCAPTQADTTTGSSFWL